MLLRVILASTALLVIKGSAEYNCTHGDVRLIDGFTHQEGLIEFCHLGAWYTICDDDFGVNEAYVTCHQLFPNENIAYTTSFLESLIKGGPGERVIFDLDCSGSEAGLVDCFYSSNGYADCGHLEDTGIRCYVNSSCVNGDVRLIGGSSENEGRVEICRDSVWAVVAHKGWDQREAQVVCKQLGFPYEYSAPIFGSEYGRGDAPLEYYDFSCSGSESSLMECGYHKVTRYTQLYFHDDEVDEGGPVVGVFCAGRESPGEACHASSSESLVRLEDGGRAGEGRLELCREGGWRSVCGDGFNQSNALALCQSLGYKITGRGPLLYIKDQPFGEGVGPIVSSLYCPGGSVDLDQCNVGEFGGDDCYHGKDVGVSCRGVDLDVAVTVESIDGNAALNRIAVGSEVELSCHVPLPYNSTGELTYVWSTSVSSPIAYDPALPVAMVTIPLNHSLEGQYFCSVYDGETLVGMGSETLTIEASIHPSTTNTPVVNNRQNPDGKDTNTVIVYFTPFSDVTLRVITESTQLPLPNLSWYREKSKLAPSDSRYIISGDTLSMTIPRATQEDRGVYRVSQRGLFVNVSDDGSNCEGRILDLLDTYPAAMPASFILLPEGDELDKSEMEFMNRRSRVQHLGLPVTFDKTKQLYFQWKWLDWDFFGHSHVQWYHNGDTELAPAIAIEPVTDKISGYYQKVSISHASILEDGVLTGHLQINATGYLTKHNCLATLSSELQYLTMDTVNLEIQYYEPSLLITSPSEAVTISDTEDTVLTCSSVGGYPLKPVSLRWEKAGEEIAATSLNDNTLQLNLTATLGNRYGEYNCLAGIDAEVELAKAVLVEEIAVMQMKFVQLETDFKNIELETLASHITQSLLTITSELCSPVEISESVFRNSSASYCNSGKEIIFSASVIYADKSGLVTASTLIDQLQTWVIRSSNGELSVEAGTLHINKEIFLATSPEEACDHNTTANVPTTAAASPSSFGLRQQLLNIVLPIAFCAVILVLLCILLVMAIGIWRTRATKRRAYSPQCREIQQASSRDLLFELEKTKHENL